MTENILKQVFLNFFLHNSIYQFGFNISLEQFKSQINIITDIHGQVHTKLFIQGNATIQFINNFIFFSHSFFIEYQLNTSSK